ncbi:MAG TPA: hypothetical protein P5253_00535 [bacterium]|jgi:hypothetical protein|nr:hypothetical protein [Dictyoglomota bacterium]HHV80132.1 hypothetical protein [bacterium]HOK29671.1 hypothetical protein [bacterium]HOL54932.1 hypothetical protein [bacterium]HPC76912.1 hypothetical protein [bacterium]
MAIKVRYISREAKDLPDLYSVIPNDHPYVFDSPSQARQKAKSLTLETGESYIVVKHLGYMEVLPETKKRGRKPKE